MVNTHASESKSVLKTTKGEKNGNQDLIKVDSILKENNKDRSYLCECHMQRDMSFLLIKAELPLKEQKRYVNHHSAGENGETKTTATSVFN